MPARSVYLVTLSLSEAGPGRFGRQALSRQASVMDIYHTMPCHSNTLSLVCPNPHLHARATTREAARLQPQGSEDATGYWAADSPLPPPLSSLLPFPLHLLCLLVNLMGSP